MATAFDTAQQDIENQRRAANAAIAAGGSAGAQAFAQGQQQVEAARNAALSQALSEAAQRGQGDIGGVLAGIVNRPYQQLGAGIASSAASHAADNAMLKGAADNYFRQVGAAVPIAAQNLEAKITLAKAKAAAKGLSDSELRTQLMGAGENNLPGLVDEAQSGHHLYQTQVMDQKKALADTNQQLGAVNKQLAAWKANKPLPNGVTPDNLLQQRQMLQSARDEATLRLADARNKRAPFSEALSSVQTPSGRDAAIAAEARRVGVESGYDPNRVTGLIKMPTTSVRAAHASLPSVEQAAALSGLNAKDVARITKPTSDGSSPYEIASGFAEKALQSGISWSTFASDLKRNLAGRPKVQRLVAARYRPLFAQANG